MALDTKKLEEGLSTQFAQAQERLQSSKTAIGIADAPQHETFGFTPRAIKIKGKMIAEAELADLNEQHGFLIEDFIRASKMVDAQTQARANIELKKEFARARDSIVKAGLRLDKEMTEARLDADTMNAIISTLGKGVMAAAKGYAIGKLRVGTTKTTEAHSTGGGGAQSLTDYQARTGQYYPGQTGTGGQTALDYAARQGGGETFETMYMSPNIPDIPSMY